MLGRLEPFLYFNGEGGEMITVFLRLFSLFFLVVLSAAVLDSPWPGFFSGIIIGRLFVMPDWIDDK